MRSLSACCAVRRIVEIGFEFLDIVLEFSSKFLVVVFEFRSKGTVAHEDRDQNRNGHTHEGVDFRGHVRFSLPKRINHSSPVAESIGKVFNREPSRNAGG